MALPLTGTITSAMILAEMGYTGNHTITNIVLRVNGVLQVLIDGIWVNLNMCSPYLPTEISPYIVPTHWYGYNHNTTGVETITILGDTTLDVGQVVTYTATLTGNNTSGVILTWYKFENNSWSLALNTGTSTTITWVDPRGAKVKVVASNICNGNTVSKIQDVTYNCTSVVPLAPWVVGTFYVGQTYELYAEKALSGGGTVVLTSTNLPLGATLLWEVTGAVDIIGSNTGYKCTIKPTAAGTTLNIRVTVLSCGSSNVSSYSNFTGTTYSTTLYGNTVQTRSIQRNNCGTGVGAYYTVTREADKHYSTVSVADANSMAVAWLNGQDAQDIANANATCGDTSTWPNDRMSQFFTKAGCSPLIGTIVEYIVPAGKYNAASVSAANTLAQNEINTNGQNNANTDGQCVSSCPQTVNSVSITTSASTFSGGTYSGTYTVNVASSGNYYVTIFPEGNKSGVEIVYLNAGSNTISYSKGYSSGFTARIGIQVSSSCNAITAYSGTVTATTSCSPPSNFSTTKTAEDANSVTFSVSYTGGMFYACNNSSYTCTNLPTMYSGQTIQDFTAPQGTSSTWTFRVYDSTNSCYTDITRTFDNTYSSGTVDVVKLSFIAINASGGISTITTWQVDNFTGSGTNIQYRYRVAYGSDLWSGWITVNQGVGTVGVFQRNGTNALITPGTVVEVEINLLAISTIQTRYLYSI